AVARRLAADPAVDYVQQNHVLGLVGTQPNPPSWGLDRIDQRSRPLDSSYTYPSTAANVHAYIIDTGIRFTHTDFGGRAVSGFDAIDGGSADDCHGHGTHVAGTTGGTAYGVAKAVQLVAVRVLSCSGSGTTAQVVAGVDWVTANAVKPAVANMSLGGGVQTALDSAVANSIASGVTYAIAAGNSNADACNFSPARVGTAITLGATDINDNRASFSNFGTCLDLFAPGVSIVSAWWTSDTATSTLSGTSMAAPHAAGVAALVASANPTFTPQQVRDEIVADATTGVVVNPGVGSPNLLLFVDNGTTPPPTCSGTNDTNVTIPDAGAAVHSPVTISGCGRNASATSQVEVHIIHPNRGDIEIRLLAPDGSSYTLKRRSNDTGDDIHATYVVGLSSEAADGTWQLQVRDRRAGNTGFLDSWTLRL
ncbi:MAG TPA: S8 family serine peptidase, partial [Micromonosporaceae bacterium]|nr:S8 family serine peptidase [Micromonosporaceae bacterium]